MNQNAEILKAITGYIDYLGLNCPPYRIEGFYGFADLILDYHEQSKRLRFTCGLDHKVKISESETTITSENK